MNDRYGYHIRPLEDPRVTDVLLGLNRQKSMCSITNTLVDSRPTPVQRAQCLIQSDNIRRQLRQNAFLDSAINSSGIRRSLDASIRDDIDIVVQIEQVISSVEDDSRGSDPRL